MAMSNYPSLREIAESWDEEYYRSRPELSYSQLSKYAREGFNGYLSLNEHIDTPSLAFGSALDCLLTEGEDSFNNKYIVSNIAIGQGKARDVIDNIKKYYLNKGVSPVRCLGDVNADAWEFALNEADYYSNLSLRDRVSKFRVGAIFSDKFEKYYLSIIDSSKKLLDAKEYSQIIACSESIKKSIYGIYFSHPQFGNIEVYHQLKFKAVFNGIGYRCMADAILIDHKNKKISPLDLKTTSKESYDFPKSFVEWRYDIQARLYWRIINSCVKHSKEFYDYDVVDYKFAVVNRFKHNTMCWKFPDTKKIGKLEYNGGLELEDPFVYGEELKRLIESKASTPINTSYIKENNISLFLKKIKK